jgi:hypothetical protein
LTIAFISPFSGHDAEVLPALITKVRPIASRRRDGHQRNAIEPLFPQTTLDRWNAQWGKHADWECIIALLRKERKNRSSITFLLTTSRPETFAPIKSFGQIDSAENRNRGFKSS